jgi:hypothetical protein
MSRGGGEAPAGTSGLRYKFVELSVVTDESLEQVVNEWVARGWHLDAIRFVVGEASRRPVMAFVSFVREDGGGSPAVEDSEAPADRDE